MVLEDRSNLTFDGTFAAPYLNLQAKSWLSVCASFRALKEIAESV